MASSANGSLGIALEPQATPGELTNILAYSAVIATASAAHQPSYSTGARLHIYVYRNTTTGTVTITGQDINGNVTTETTPTIPIMPTTGQNQEVSKFEYVTSATYGSINAGGITTTGLTNGFLKIGQMPSARSLVPATVSIDSDIGDFSPVEHRALSDLNTREFELNKKASVSVETVLYPDSSLWFPYTIMNNATSPGTPTTTPGSATTFLAATAVSLSPLSLTTQPTAPGMCLILTIASATTSGSIAIVGRDARTREATSETVYGSGNGTYYSANTYSSVNASGLVITGFASGTLVVSGVFGWNRTWLSSQVPQPASIEFYTGTDSVIAPYTCFEEITLEFDVEKDLKITAKGIAQDRLIIGNRTTNPMSLSQVATLAQPMDTPLAGWQCQVYLDAMNGTPGTTLFGDMITGKVTMKAPFKEIYNLDNNQYFNVVYRKKISVDFEGKIDYTNALQMEAFRQNTKQYLQLLFSSRTVGAAAQQTISVIIPLKILKFPIVSKPDGDYVEATISGIGEYDSGIGGSYKLVWSNSQMSPNYNGTTGGVITVANLIYYNVKDYGAVGDGVTDDTAFIQAAITAAQNAGGGGVFFPDTGNSYLLSSSLIITHDNIELIGAGWGSQLLAKTGFGANPMIWVQAPGGTGVFRRGIRIQDLFINGNSVTGVIGIQLDCTYNAEIYHCWVRFCLGLASVYLNGTASTFGAYTNILACAITDGGASTGVLTNDHEHITIIGGLIAWFTTAGGIGVNLQNSASRIVGCSFDECDTSVQLWFCTSNAISSCHFDRGLTQFINVQGAKSCRIGECVFSGFVGSGAKNIINVSNSGNARNIFVGNIIETSTGWTNFVVEASGTGTPPNSYLGNETTGYGITQFSGIFRANVGYNPVGHITSPAVPATTVAYTNNFGIDCTVFVTGGTVSAIAIGGTATGLITGTFRVPAQQTITLTYSALPTWQWFGD